jgi:DNA repair ATPase RecN
MHELSRKHRVAPEGLAAQRDALLAELESLRQAGDRLRALDAEQAAALERWNAAAAVLSQARREAAARLSLDTTRLVAELGMGGRFEVALDPVEGGRPDPQGAERQELCVTHLPQVAAQGHQHLLVSKAVEGGGTRSAVAALDDKARVEELARMLGGLEITREVRANARQMLESARKK